MRTPAGQRDAAAVYTVVPVTSFRYHFYWGLVYTVPEFSGVFLVDSDGRIRFLTQSEALRSPILAGNRIFPEKLAVIPTDGAGIAYQVFVNAAGNQVYHVKTDEEIAAFVENGARGLSGLGATGNAGAGTGVGVVEQEKAATTAGVAPSSGSAEDNRRLLEDMRMRLREMERLLDDLEKRLP